MENLETDIKIKGLSVYICINFNINMSSNNIYMNTSTKVKNYLGVFIEFQNLI